MTVLGGGDTVNPDVVEVTLIVDNRANHAAASPQSVRSTSACRP
ncbi:hypothetical protein I541_5247 [Mycobacteroides abscessus]|nr:hypothetical protein I541_5247 [Mycobacteroides abscessus]